MRLSRYSIIGIMVALLLTAVAIIPVFGATTGAISVNKSFVAPGGSATITVDDADLNTLLPRTMTGVTPGSTYSGPGDSKFFNLLDSAGQSGTGGSGFGTGTALGDEIAGTPVIAAITAGPDTTIANYSVGVFNAATGRIFITYGGASTTFTPTFTLTYNLAQVNTTSADVTSPSDTTGIKVTLTETGANTGVFAGLFNVTVPAATASSDTTDTILAVAGQTITVRYADADPVGNRTSSLTVENTNPVGTLVSPAHKSITASGGPVLTVDFTDSDSGVTAGTLGFTISGATDSTNTDVSGTVTLGTVTTTAITNGFRGTATATGTVDNNTYGITWFASATDAAGNTGRTDADPATAGDQDFILYIDRGDPDFGGATANAGTWFDTTTNKVVTDKSKSINTSIGIKLPDMTGALTGSLKKVEQLNGGTVVPGDFDVDTLKQTNGVTLSDVTPSAAMVYPDAPNWIFLTVPAMAPDAKPKVTLVSSSGGISDSVGNTQTTGEVTALDAQAPKPTYSLNRSLSDTSVTVSITTNEAGGVPIVTAKGKTGSIAQSVTLTGTNQYQAVIQQGVVGNGAHSVIIDVSDANGNTTTLGSATVTDDFPDSTVGNIAVYFDDDLPAPVITITGSSNNILTTTTSVEQTSRFVISTVYTAEGAEYGLDATGALNLASATTIVDDLDVHGTVTIKSATLDGATITGDTTDNIGFDFIVGTLTTGEHVLQIVAEDAAGNEHKTGEVKFTVTQRKAYEVAMKSGWNLISFPGQVDVDSGTPGAQNSISDVFPSTHPATQVLTYENGVFMAAVRSTTSAPWEGDLTTIDQDKGYFVFTSGLAPVKALLSLVGGGVGTIPTIEVEAGWNLVSAIDLDQVAQGKAGSTQPATTYFSTLPSGWVAYGFDATTQRYGTRINSSSGAGVTVDNGAGYWVYATESAVIVP